MKRNHRHAAQRFNQVWDIAFCSHGTILASVFFFLTGISTGVFLELTMSAGEKSNLASSLQQYLFVEASKLTFDASFWASASNNLVLLVVMFLAGLSVFGFPVVYAVLAYKGMALGFCSGLILENLQAKGISVILASLLPQNLILIPSLLLAAMIASNYARRRLATRKIPQKKNPIETSSSYLLAMIFLAVAVLLGAAVEAILSSTVPLP